MNENPIYLIKEGKHYPASYFQKLKKPFIIYSPRISILVEGESTPVYFKRVRKSISMSRGERTVWVRYCIGSITEKGTKTVFWLDDNGNPIEYKEE